jgi:membrane-bound ClpP family serine protease
LQFRVGPNIGKVRIKMLSLGVVLLILGYIFNIGILITIGWILAVIGLVLFVLGAIGRPLAGRRYWY